MKAEMLQFFSTADNITAIAAASYVLWSAGAGIYRRTLGSRSRTARALHSLTPGNPMGLVESLFGAPVYSQARRRFTQCGDELESDGEQSLYNARHGWLTVHYRQGKVIAFAFMLTDRRFRFDLSPTCRGVVSGILGRTTYRQIWAEPIRAVPSVGAYNWSYSELHSFGRGGNYQDYVFSNTLNGWSHRCRTHEMPPFLPEFSPLAGDPDWMRGDREVLSRFRSLNAPDTVAVFGTEYGSEVAAVVDSGSFDQDDMRNLEGSGPKGWLSRSAFEQRERRLRPLRALQNWWWRRQYRRQLQ